MIEVSNLSVRFGDFYAIRNVSFSVRRGEIFGFLGANGAGKTTTVRVLCGLLPPSSGSVLIEGIDFGLKIQKLKARVGYMSQRFTLYTDLTVEENMEFAAELRKIRPKDAKQRIQELFEFIGFDQSPKVLVRDLPGGVRQQVSLAAAVVHNPDVVFLDEPTAGVAPGARARFWNLIRKLASQNKTVFITTHYMDEAEECNRIALMRAGELIALDSPQSLKSHSFCHGVYELTPKSEDHEEKIDWTRVAGAAVRQCGLRFHAFIIDPSVWSKEMSDLERRFRISKSEPSLEDVFLHLLEGNSR